MKYRKLGNSGASVSNLILGTMGFGTETPEKEAFAILDAYLDAGGNMIDTADVYGTGASEELLGRWRSGRKDKVDRLLVATKARFGTGPDVNDAGTSRPHLHRALNTSLRRLGVEAIDLYQMHGWDPLTPVEETLSFLDAAARAGKIHYVGLSNFTGWQVQLVLSTARAMGLQVPITLQQQYSLVYREIEYEVVPAALHNGIGILPWSPLAAGFLSGKYHRENQPAEGTRLAKDGSMIKHMGKGLYAADRNWDTIETVRRIAGDIGSTPSQVSLAWVTNRPGVSASIIGARTMEQLQDNLGAADLDLEEAVTAKLDAVSAPRPDDYPYGRFGVLQRDRYIDSSDQALKELAS
ncbi:MULTISPECIES: aldo/keto reductase [Rhizobium]|uniref:Aldo/keto reductase n=1 Tax=Rhizobium tropici TaxID=398 RepID=A0A6P1C4L1_RHITR|nr:MULTISPECIES: aldo/keto reductase [Rhizobium]AGB73118.1 putative oxidoreductase, aldo/keto reductase family [Rhizobium tropici CIAT 899]MBB4243622.1 aryl-alcohol dehydrogenase-like predicted oxidoreductase [Rhizobium tropici]MBB5595929.1 aryl-alcohol dehydrogenase-like predicted oxidoreductase [Rhizobium tropici]MBB6493922.1 aryl-alcohol dehydrogenase-like predicted oxidoreductase [Rhizobium tropici]NEV11356.1 aldo/keto reductase [Rhizobium tropici]